MREIVIKLSDEEYEELQSASYYRFDKYTAYIAMKNGIVLPKGHGRLVDIDKIDDDRMESDNPVIELTTNRECIEAVSLDYLNDLPTIIEADKESENDT